jgi:FAD-linked oxidoreductase
MLSLSQNKLVWENWSRVHRCYPKYFFSPESEDEIVHFFKTNTLTKIRIVGSGHSFSPIVPTDSVLINLNKLQGVIHIDRKEMTIEVWGGTKLYELNKVLDNEELAMINMGDVDRQSLAGALCTGTHGTGSELGILATAIESFSLITPSGEVLQFEKNVSNDFSLAVINLGMLGIVTKIKLKVTPKYRIKISKKKISLGNCLDHLNEMNQKNRHYEFFWFPYSDVVQECISNVTEEEIRDKNFIQIKLNYFLENHLFYFLSLLCRFFPILCSTISKISTYFLSNEERVNDSYKIYANSRNVRFQEMELAIEAHFAKKAILEIDDFIKRNKVPVHFPIEVRFTAADEFALSASFERKTCYIAFHQFEGMPYEDYFKGMQNLLIKYSPRAHWGKMSFFKTHEYKNLYPNLDRFIQLRRKLDPKSLMLNDWLEKIFK